MATISTMIKNRSLVTLGFSESVSNTGNWITMMAVYAMIVFRNQGGVAETSGVFLAGLLPTLACSPLAGWLCDRYDRRTLMIASELVSGLAISGLIFVNEIGWIYALLALQAVSVSIMTPARQSVVPDLVARDQLTQANAFLQQLAGIIKIGAPMLAGLILTVLNPHQAIILDVVSFALSAVILSRLPALPPHARQAPEGTDRAEAKSQSTRGIARALKATPDLRLLFMLVFLSIMVIVGFDVLAPVYTRDVLNGGESFFGLMVGLVGLGTLAGSLILMARKTNRNPWQDTLLGMVLLSLVSGSVGLASLVPNPVLAKAVVSVGMVLGGVGNGWLVVQSGTLLQLLSPADLLGMMGGIYQGTALAGQLVGILVTPLVVPGLVSMGAYFLIATLLLCLLAAYTARVLGMTRLKNRAVDSGTLA